MGLCTECIYYTKQGTSFFDTMKNGIFGMGGCNDIGFCMLMVDYYGNPKKVKGLDGCHCGGFAKRY